MKTKKINWWGQACVLACDGQCHKAWGIDARPRQVFDRNDEDDMALHADHEFDVAPPSRTTEGSDGKPDPASIGEGEGMNRWCSRNCERSVIAKPGEEPQLPDYSKRLYNQPWKHKLP